MDIPNPLLTGSTGTQQPVDGPVVLPEPYNPLAGLPLAQRVEGLAATHARNLGGEVAATLIAGSFSQLSDDLRIQREQNAEQLAKTSRLQDDLTTYRTQTAVLEERLRAVERTQSVKQVAVFAGTAMLAVAVDLYKGQLDALAAIVAVLGAGLLVFSWFTGHGGTSK
ncbi:MAG: hypothetical protein NTW45_07620 [Rhodocyclales bacterium]|nr:hypothetical protein [Rhodocyclales bacterium]